MDPHTSHLTPHVLSDIIATLPDIWDDLSDHQRDALSGVAGVSDAAPDISDIVSKLLSTYNGHDNERALRQRTFIKVVKRFSRKLLEYSGSEEDGRDEYSGSEEDVQEDGPTVFEGQLPLDLEPFYTPGGLVTTAPVMGMGDLTGDFIVEGTSLPSYSPIPFPFDELDRPISPAVDRPISPGEKRERSDNEDEAGGGPYLDQHLKEGYPDDSEGGGDEDQSRAEKKMRLSESPK